MEGSHDHSSYQHLLFVSLVLVMVYLGGILVVFVYSVSLAADPYPEAWANSGVAGYVVGYLFLLVEK